MTFRIRLQQISARLRQHSLWWLTAIVLFFTYDIVTDISENAIDTQLVVEAIIFVICSALLFSEWRRGRQLKGRLEEAQAHSQRLSGQFSAYVRESFVRWNFSRSEQEVAWLILKGCSFAEIATLRAVQEKTVRQQATAIYAKSGCGNRNGFIAHFIQDLLTGDVVAGEPSATPEVSSVSDHTSE